jgi:lysine-N-methylase
MHARFGEPSKPLACRLYPYTFHPGPDELRVGLRFSCPSVVSNRGVSVAAQKGTLIQLANEVVPRGYSGGAAVGLSRHRPLDWPQLELVVSILNELLGETEHPVVLRVLWCLGWLGLLEQSAEAGSDRFSRLAGDLARAVQAELPQLRREAPQPPSAMARRLFRMTVAQYSRKDTFRAEQRTWSYRWRLLRSIWRFTSGRGTTPVLQEGFSAVPFAELETSCGELTPEMEERLTRYLQVKVQSLHFCGPAYYGAPVVEGFASLALAVAASCYVARWLARGAGRERWELADLERAIAVVDHHHGFSPALGLASFRARQRWLWSQREVTRLVLWYGQ